MKLLVFIFAFYFVGISALTCNDEVSQSLSSKCEQHSHEDNHDHEGMCSPFCHCSCCSISAIGDGPELLEDSITFRCDTQHNISHATPSYDGFNASILQPPQLNSSFKEKSLF